MTSTAPVEPPVAIERVQRVRGEGDDVQLRLSGRWLLDTRPDEHEALLVIQLQGRRHRFPAAREPAGATAAPGTWQAEFTIPSWAVPSRPGQAAVWLGNAVIGVDPPGATPPPPLPAEVAAVGQAASTREETGDESDSESTPPKPAAEAPSRPGPPPSEPPAPELPPEFPPDPGRAGPLADLLFKETVAALHAELERRSGEAAQLRGTLAAARSDLDSRATRQAGLESAHTELRRELERLMEAVARQRQDFDERLMAHGEAERRSAVQTSALREQLAAAQVSRDAAISEAGGLRTEIERLAAELAVAREQLAAHGGDLGEAERLLVDARALAEQLRTESG